MNLFQRLKDAFTVSQQPTVRIPDGPHTPPVRKRFRFSGLVQGVGFRWEAQTLADQLDLTGWARNENNGDVLIEIQGKERRIDEFLRAMRAVPRFDITDIRVRDLPLSGSETSFKALY